MKTSIIVLSVCSIMLHVAAFVIWTKLFGKLERRIWWPIWAGFLVMIWNRMGETLGWFSILGGNTMALAIAIIALVAALYAQRVVKKREEARLQMLAIQEKINKLQVVEHGSIAHKLAEILADFNEQLKFYESQASDAGLPSYKRD